MNISRILCALGLSAVLLPVAPPAAPPATEPTVSAADAALVRLSNEYFDQWYFPAHPSEATQAGIHDFDTRLEDNRRTAIDEHIAALHGYEQRFAAVPLAALSEHQAGNLELLLSSVRSQLLTLETIRPWEKDPDTYPSALANTTFISMAHRFAPGNERLRRLIERERLMPVQLAAARVNLNNPPLIYTQIALQQLPATIAFFRNDVPAAFGDADDAPLRAAFATSNAAVVAALASYQQWLKNVLLPRSHGDFRLGETVFRRKLLEIGAANLRLNQRAFARIAQQLEPRKSARQVLEQLTTNHPPPDQLLQSVRDQFAGLRAFLEHHEIITIPDAAPPTVEETPPFLRATTSASMDTPGPFEIVATETYFNVTLPDPAWDKAKTDDFMTQWNYPLLSNTAVHEAYPGHYLQFLWMHQVPDRVRKLVGASSNDEGWAHYCEQMMLDEGLGQPAAGAGNPHDALWLRLGQLQDALLRNARYMVAINMHSGSMNYEQAVEYFMREGFPPLKIVRRAMLHDDSPTL